MAIPKIGILSRTYRHVQRYRQIITVLLRFGFGDLIDRLKLEPYLEMGKHVLSRGVHEHLESMTTAQRVRLALEELGPTFIKAGQILSTRPDLLPAELVDELAKLQRDVPAFPFAQAKEIIEWELHVPLSEVFTDFAERPLAAASLGQVHFARLRSGQSVVVKVQRPNIRRTIDVDLEILRHLAGLGERYLEGWHIHRPTHIVDELARTIARELDYTVEAAHMERFARSLANDPTVFVPAVFRELTTPRVLTMEYMEGISAAEVDRLRHEGYDCPLIARRGAELVMKQLFLLGFFHADPHPGNIFVLPGNRIGFVDFGMMGRLNRQRREQIADLILGVVACDERKTVDAVLDLADVPAVAERAALERDVAELIDQHLHRPMREFHFGRLLRQMLDLAARYALRMPADLFLMLKALSTVESVARSLSPEFDIAQTAAPFLRKVQRSRYHPRRVAQDLFETGFELARLAGEVPRTLRILLRQAAQGRLHLEFEHRNLEPLLSTLDQVSNRLAFSVVLAALIIGSSLIVLADLPPKWNEIPVIGLVGFLMAGLMGFRLLLSILRHGRM